MGSLPGLHTGQASLDALQGGKPAVVFLDRLLGGLVSGVDRTADRTRQKTLSTLPR